MDLNEYQKFIYRNSHNYDRQTIKEKLADLLFIVTDLATRMDISLEELADLSYQKEKFYLSVREQEVIKKLDQMNEQMIFDKEHIENIRKVFGTNNPPED